MKKHPEWKTQHIGIDVKDVNICKSCGKKTISICCLLCKQKKKNTNNIRMAL